MKRLSFVVDGSGWRAMFYVRIAKRYPELFDLQYVLCRSEEKAQHLREEGIAQATAQEDLCIQAKPDFVVTAVTRTALYGTTQKWLQRGFPVFSETPVATSVDQLQELWEQSQRREAPIRLQTAEQYWRYPILSAGLKRLEQGAIGDPYAAVLSAAHDYHAASLLRHMLRIRPQLMVLRGTQYTFPVTETMCRAGAITDGRIAEKDRTVIHIAYECGKMAVYDFSGVQYHSAIRARHLNVQGSNGEWNDTVLRYVDDRHLPVEERLTAKMDPEKPELDTEELSEQSRTWSPFLTLDGAQDEYAIASMMVDFGAYLETGREVYLLADSLEDAYTWLLFEEAVRCPGEEVRSERMPWHGKNLDSM